MTVENIRDFVSQSDRIAELEEEVRKLKNSKAEWKWKYWKLKKSIGHTKPKTRTQKALEVIETYKADKCKPIIACREIAKKCHLSEGYVLDLWYGCY